MIHMYINDSDLDLSSNLTVASKLINEFLKMDPIEKSQLSNGFIISMIEPFLGKRDQFDAVLRDNCK